MRKKKINIPYSSTSSESGMDVEENFSQGSEAINDEIFNHDPSDILALVNEFKINEFEEIATEFLCSSCNHPAISYLREIHIPDISYILLHVGKLKKRMGTLELGVLYFGLIDSLASTIDNALCLDERHNKTQNKKIPAKVQKIMLEFKNIIGSWGISDNELFKKRYETVMRSLRNLIPRFDLIAFGQTFSKILESLEREIAKNRQNSEMMKALSGNMNSTSPTNKQGSSVSNQEPEVELAHNIELDIAMDIDDDDDDDDVFSMNAKIDNVIDDVIKNAITEDKHKTKAISSNKKRLENGKTKKPQTLRLREDVEIISPAKLLNPVQFERINQGKGSSPKPINKLATVSNQDVEIIHIDSHNPSNEDNESSPRKKPRLALENIENEVHHKQKASCVADNSCKVKLNAFTLLMNKSKELAKQNKQKIKK